ncbi:MAG: bifunctional phosphoribosylaminoimidazolecarboxamide formyltransferase/IMP cyclohydrolase [Candidatus Fluviicola riflensis]|nr:MAG: bifunctional phosphoribosylaminoimidazolecarboxamide formyltransferase/IMP cyclohydrolase [Candidatus Fluviicola riflensis]OGS78333.1 MAG: bifunctional phosphoribosylaminoimidazolecarboxamide formyltransferase/IMP cyclohydrolase [Candidatus Fluviicola riflensis]OGS85399.1 MAG: bifunctional phosphoribosylaminoimidazolecarboxamide formyltransferase/IMP cyclohydrolase [Fluviicola sp. RIFCSPHIGHO2_01_FULL_43_53]OGS87441.1 MAG: bifunctional phosphoribosylaminoimidazolecarboxamide formyltransf
MEQSTKITAALISVYYKDGLEPIVRRLHADNVVIYSTGGTQAFIEALGIPVVAVESMTNYPEIFGGRVKTLHPAIFGGILHRRNLQSDLDQATQFNIPTIDLVIVDLYPFEETLASGAAHQDIIEKIDIGGISLIRAAAKNYNDVVIIPSVNQYGRFQEILEANGATTTLEERKAFARDAFMVSSHYDTHIFRYFNQEEPLPVFKESILESQPLRYGENPHQRGWFHGDFSAMFDQLHGKELSYNNLLDVDAAVQLMAEFKDNDPTFAILKHNNACGLATRSTLKQAYADALAGDPTSAFGGILIANRPIDLATAELVNDLFCEVVVAPSFDADALEVLKSKKNRILLIQKEASMPKRQFRTLLNGVLEQDKDLLSETAADFTPRTNTVPTAQEVEDLVFANKLVKHTKSNTIILAKNGQLIASGTGETSRVDALRHAIEKAKAFQFDLNGAVMASDAFFPFPDCVEIAHLAGITAVVQPGGSIKDELSIDYCNANGVAMVFTGNRHFKH